MPQTQTGTRQDPQLVSTDPQAGESWKKFTAQAGPQAELGPDDYHVLFRMLTSSDEGTRAQGQALARKLRPSEQQDFYKFQRELTTGQRAAPAQDWFAANGIQTVPVRPDPQLVSTDPNYGLKTYEVAAPNGKVLEITGPHPPSEAELRLIFKQAGVETDAKPYGPRGSERTRPDTNIIGVDHERLQQSIANWASTLRPEWQKPAAMLATFPADVLASLVEMFSSPEAVATGGARVDVIGHAADATNATISAAGRAATGASRATIRAGAAVGDIVHPDVVGVISPRAGKALDLAQRMRDKLPPRGMLSTSAASPAGTNVAGSPLAAPSTRPSAPVPAATAPLRLTFEEQQALEGLVRRGYSRDAILAEMAKQRAAGPTPAAATPSGPTLKAAETKEYLRLLKTGKSSQEAMELIQAQRALTARLGLPTSEDVRRAIETRNQSGQWRE